MAINTPMSHKPWIHNGSPLAEPPDGAVGFVYLITNSSTGRKYVGKKSFTTQKIRTKAGKRKKVRVESDWKTYIGSCDTLKEEAGIIGVEYFEREILHICYSKAEMTYLELAEQVKREVLLSNDYYNGWLSARVSQANLAKYAERIKKD